MPDIPKYQKDYSLSRPDILEKRLRTIKVKKMLCVLRDTGILEDKKYFALDIGCSGGYFVEGLAPYFITVIGLDIDSNALEQANNIKLEKNVIYMAGDSMNIPLKDNSVDLVICNHVYEHVPDPVRLFSEIYRVLAINGICYFGAASRLTLFEPHYHLPFLSWLPKPIAHRYMRMMNKGEYYYENLRTYRGICSLVEGFSITDYTLSIVCDPDKYAARDLIPENSLVEKIPLILWKMVYWILPGYIFILSKRDH